MSHRDLLNQEMAYQALEHLTVARAVRYLTYIFDCGEHEIYVGSRQTTPYELGTDLYTSGCLADRVIIWFWGGPPDYEDWFEGTLLTMLIDKLFFCVANELDDVVDKFLETLNGSKTKQTS